MRIVNSTEKISHLILHNASNAGTSTAANTQHYVELSPGCQTDTVQPFFKRKDKLDDLKNEFPGEVQDKVWPPRRPLFTQSEYPGPPQ